jgi:hypothetical protein
MIEMLAAGGQAMTHAELRDRVRKLIAKGEPPSEPPVIQSSGQGGWWPTSARRTSPGETCTICVEPDPTVACFSTGGRVAKLHAACDALWKQEQSSRTDSRRATFGNMVAPAGPLGEQWLSERDKEFPT